MTKKFGFIVLAPQPNLALIKTSLNNALRYSDNVKVVIPIHTDVRIIRAVKELVPMVGVGGNTITSLINEGFKDANGWQITTMAGSPLAAGLVRKLDLFIQEDNDIVYSVVSDIDRNGNILSLNNTFYTCSLNGVCINAKTFKRIGNMREEGELQHVRMEWAAWALAAGCKFKGIVGLRA